MLIVEDDPSVAAAIEALLQDEGYRTLRAETGRQAMDLAHQHHPDLVTLDLYLREGDGLEVLYELKARPDTTDIPVIVVSGYTMLLVREDRLRLAEVISKAFDMERLLDAVKRVLKAPSPAAASGRSGQRGQGRRHQGR